MASYPLEITHVAIITNGTDAVAAYYAGDALRKCTAIFPSDTSEASAIAEAQKHLPIVPAPTAEFVVIHDRGDSVKQFPTITV